MSSSGAQDYTGTATLNSDYTTSGGSFTISGSTILANGASITTSNGSVTLGTVNGANTLTIDAGTGDVTRHRCDSVADGHHSDRRNHLAEHRHHGGRTELYRVHYPRRCFLQYWGK